MIIIIKATQEDRFDFSELTLLSAPYFSILFGDKIKIALQDMFCYKNNLFSYEHTNIIKINGETAGMVLSYAWQEKRRENLKTGFLLIKKLGIGLLRKSLILKNFSTTVGRLCKGEYYLSNIAIYPRFRGKGLGKELIEECEKRARIMGVERIILDVENDNLAALSFYKNLGFSIISEFSIFLQMGKTLFFNRMAKII